MSKINDFYRDGYSLDEPLPALLSNFFHAQVRADNYIDDGHGTCLIAEWESDLPSENLNIPSQYLNLMKNLSSGSEISKWLQVRFGEFSRINVMLQKSKPGHEMDWHYDGLDPMHLVCMIYLTENEWDERDGGQLLIGEGDCNEIGLIDDTSAVRQIAAISPAPGRVVWTLNTNPRQLHKVTAVRTDQKERYVLIGQFGYRENAENTKVKEHIAGWR